MISVYAEARIEDFDDDDVLRGAAEIVYAHRRTPEPPRGDPKRAQWLATDSAVEALARALGLNP